MFSPKKKKKGKKKGMKRKKKWKEGIVSGDYLITYTYIKTF